MLKNIPGTQQQSQIANGGPGGGEMAERGRQSERMEKRRERERRQTAK